MNISKTMLVIGIAGVIIYAVLSVYNPFSFFQIKYDNERKSDLLKIQLALAGYYNDHGFYPANDSSYNIVDKTPRLPGTNWIPYLKPLPQDPENKKYVYVSDSQGQSYRLYASLDNIHDPALCYPGISQNCEFAPPNACGGICNYGVSSSNASP